MDNIDYCVVGWIPNTSSNREVNGPHTLYHDCYLYLELSPVKVVEYPNPVLLGCGMHPVTRDTLLESSSGSGPLFVIWSKNDPNRITFHSNLYSTLNVDIISN